MVKLISEGLPSDGSFQLHKILNAVNKRLGELGKYGKRAKLKQSGDSISLQFSLQGEQKQKGCGCSFSKDGIKEAEKIAGLVTGQLSANTFTWEWFDSLIGKKVDIQEEKKSCKELITEYKTHWFKENKKLKNPTVCWLARFRHIEKVMAQTDSELSLSIIKQIIEKTENNSNARIYVLQALKAFLEYFNISEYNNSIQSYKAKNKPSAKKRNVPSDSQGYFILKSCLSVSKPKDQSRWACAMFSNILSLYKLREKLRASAKF